MELKNKILYKGISKKLNSKRELMKQSLKYGQVRSALANEMFQEEIRDNVKMKTELVKGGVQVQIKEEELSQLFDVFLWKKLNSAKKEQLTENAFGQILLEMVDQNGTEISIDTTNMIAYGILQSERCLQKLYDELEKTKLYDVVLETFRKSEYIHDGFEEILDAKFANVSRLVRGLLIYFRNEESIDLYEMIMRIIYAGYKKQKNLIKKLRVLDMEVLRDDVIKIEKSALSSVCELVLMFVIAEDLGKLIEWDFEMLSLLKLMQGYEKELNGSFYTEEHISAKMTEEQKEIIKKVITVYGTKDSVENLFYDKHQEEFFYLISMMNLLHVSPRKLQLYKLTEKEILTILMQKDKWKNIDYMYCMIIAVLCKYIVSLEKVVAEIDDHRKKKEIVDMESEKNRLLNLKREIEFRQNRLEEKEKQRNKEIMEFTKHIEKQQKKSESDQELIERQEQELKELRNYIYGLKKDWQEDSTFDFEEQDVFWKNQKVLVLGGHPNWQKKLKEKYPNWQFLSANIKSFPLELIYDKDYIICNAEFLSHGTYYKVVSAREKNQRILYVHSNNMELCMRELAMQKKVMNN